MESMIASKTTRASSSKPLIDIINLDVFDNEAERGVPSTKENQVPVHQRFPSWEAKKKEPLVDTIMQDFPMSGILLTQDIVPVNDEHVQVNFIQDGQTRLSILQDFIKGKFTWREKFYTDLTESERARFNNYPVRVELIRKKPGVSVEEFKNICRTIFGRINSGKPLTDNDKYHNCLDEPLLKMLMQIKNDPEFYVPMKKIFGDIGSGKTRTGLANMVGVMLALATGNSDCITPSYINNAHYVISESGSNTAVIITEAVKERTKEFMRWYIKLTADLKEQITVKKIKPGFLKKIGGFLALVLTDYIDGLAVNRRAMWMHYATKFHTDEQYEKRLYKTLEKGTLANNSAVNFRKRIQCIMVNYATSEEDEDEEEDTEEEDELEDAYESSNEDNE